MKREIDIVKSDTIRQSFFHAISTSLKCEINFKIISTLLFEITNYVAIDSYSSNQIYESLQSLMRKANFISKSSQVSSTKIVESFVTYSLLRIKTSKIIKFLELSCTHQIVILAIFLREKKHWKMLIKRHNYDMYLSNEENRNWKSCVELSRIALQRLFLRRYENDYNVVISFYEHYWMKLIVLRKIATFVELLRSWFTRFRIED